MKPIINLIIITLLTFTLTSCELVGAIFKGGMWTGIILVLGVIVLIIWGVAKAFGGGGRG
ncbi:hypothetical protein DYBT9275_03073 [Dyadobacter sp. CECT 9275]|uniref:Phosphatidate cytidylyltransferase n=1 Tax=Dyadobacter helix TaxID=2822344 RepID=A0A916JFF0_9BACT|nr:hypothetical protein [Dyadobacter sp. CECT 9275]CAG5003149.1 hypothetical protein DYBT9275_03073 [Dyadobacter sp. CECT 9275]